MNLIYKYVSKIGKIMPGLLGVPFLLLVTLRSIGGGAGEVSLSDAVSVLSEGFLSDIIVGVVVGGAIGETGGGTRGVTGEILDTSVHVDLKE